MDGSTFLYRLIADTVSDHLVRRSYSISVIFKKLITDPN